VGVVAGLAVFGGALVVGIPALFAVGAGAVAFASGYTLTPRRKTAAEILLAPEVTQQTLDDFRRRITSAVARMRELQKRIGRTSMAGRIDALSALLDKILATCERDPQDIRAARSLPFYVEKIEEYVKGYVDVYEVGEQDQDVLNRLRGTEAMVVRATDRFEEIHRAMIENDLRALEAKAGALSMEFGTEEPARPASEGASS
jgi:5-bromo-4-chloroindolyl phosphate hydrolysis protein